MKRFDRAVIAMAVFSILFALCGCSREVELTASELKTVSISCGSMDQLQSYSFSLSKTSGAWTLTADCVLPSGKALTDFEAVIDEKDADTVFKIIESGDLISVLAKGKSKKTFAADETMYSSAMTFENGRTLSASRSLGSELENELRSLAEKYGE